MPDVAKRLLTIDFESTSCSAEDVLMLIAYQAPTILRHATTFDDGRLWLGPLPRVDHPHHIRAHLEAAHMLSVLVGRPALCDRWRNEGFYQESHDQLADILTRAIETACAYHRTDGSWTLPNMPTPWGDGWQTALWTYRLARMVWEAGDVLPEHVVMAARRVIAHEADRFIGVDPPSGYIRDTKMEENAWDAMLLAWAPLACPGHPHAADWGLAAKTWAVNAMVRPIDRFDRSWMDGRQVQEWLTATTLFPDFTCENHGTFHVGYQACVVENAWAALAYVASGQAVPPQFTWNMREVEEILLWFNFEDSSQMMVTGNDWTNAHGLHQSTPVSAYFTRTPRALRIARANLARTRDLLLQSENGHVFSDTLDENVGDQRWFFHTCNTSWLADAFYVMPLPAPIPERSTEAAVPVGVRSFPYVEVISHRNKMRLASAAWRTQYKHPLFTVLPIHRSDWQSWAPFTGIGRLETDPTGGADMGRTSRTAGPAIAVRTHDERESPFGFATSGALLHRDEQGAWAEQCLAWVVIDEAGALLLVDCVKALRPVRIARNEGLMFSIGNEYFNGYERRIRGEVAQFIVRGLSGEFQVRDLGKRATVDGLLTIIGSEPLAYRSPGRRLEEDNRFGSTQYDRVYSPFKTGSFASGEIVRAGAWILTFEERSPWVGVEVEIAPGVCRARIRRSETASDKGDAFTAELQLEPPFAITISPSA